MNPTHTLPTTDPAEAVEPAEAIEVTAEVTPADVLRAAACYLAWHGWTQGYYYGSASGTGPAHLTPPACALGAIAMAAYGHPVDDPFDADRPERRDFAQAAEFFTDYLDIRHGDFHPDMSIVDFPDGPDVATWNDQDGRTAEQVIAALLAAADDWEHTHRHTAEGGAR